MSEMTNQLLALKSEWQNEYRKRAVYYEKLVDETAYTLKTALEKEGIKYHNIVCRPNKIKDFESFYEKVNRKKIQNIDLSKIEDIAGIRVICLYRSDLKSVRKVISHAFTIIKEDTSRTRTAQPFGYLSDHFIVKFPDYCKGTRYDDLKGLFCEIQVRTILMDAWASVSHHLDYKQELDIPLELRANFNALSGLFYVADTNFELFKKGIEEERQKLLKAAKSGCLEYDKVFNLDMLTTYLKQVFPTRKRSSHGYSELSDELRKYGYDTLAKIDAAIKPTLPFLDAFENDLLIKDKHLCKYKAPFFADVGMIRIALPLADSKYGADEPGDKLFNKLMAQYQEKIYGKNATKDPENAKQKTT